MQRYGIIRARPGYLPHCDPLGPFDTFKEALAALAVEWAEDRDFCLQEDPETGEAYLDAPEPIAVDRDQWAGYQVPQGSLVEVVPWEEEEELQA